MKFFFFVIACGVVGFAAQMPTAKTQNAPKVSDAIHQLFVEDGEDVTHGISKFSEEQLDARGNARRETVRALLAPGALKTGEDFPRSGLHFSTWEQLGGLPICTRPCDGGGAKGKRRGKVDRSSNTGQVPTVDWATPSIRDAISPRPKSATSPTSRSWFPSGFPFRKNASALQRAVPAGFGATRLLRSGAGAAKGEPGDVQRRQTPDRHDEGSGLPALGRTVPRLMAAPCALPRLAPWDREGPD
jgi:hypothetical protein